MIMVTPENYFEMAIKNVALFKHYSKGLINESYLSQLYDQGYSDYSNGNYESAIEKLKAVCDKDMNYREGMAVYYLAQSYRKNGEDNVAKTYYQYVIDHYPNTESAKTAENYVD